MRFQTPIYLENLSNTYRVGNTEVIYIYQVYGCIYRLVFWGYIVRHND